MHRPDASCHDFSHWKANTQPTSIQHIYTQVGRVGEACTLTYVVWTETSLPGYFLSV
jgi:hypothetical protein